MRSAVLSGLFLFPMFIAGCKKDISDVSNSISGKMLYRSSCKAVVLQDGLAKSDTITILYTYDASLKQLQLTHVNAVLNSCSDSAYCIISNVGSSITIEEMELIPRCNSLGYFNLKIELSGVEATFYRINMKEPDSSSREGVVFTVDLEDQTEGMLKIPVVFRCPSK